MPDTLILRVVPRGKPRSGRRSAAPRRRVARSAAALLFLGGVLGLLPSAPVRAEVEAIAIHRREPLADGHAFGLAGAYEKLVGEVTYSLDPAAPGNAAVVDLDRAPRDADGRVRFRGDVYILKPVDPGKGNGSLLVEIPNRGGKAAVFYFDRGAARTRDPLSREDFGDGFLLHRGFTLVWVGWQWDVPADPELLRLEVVRAAPGVRGGEAPIEGLVRADHVFPAPAELLPLAHRDHRAYPAVDPDDPRNLLTVRDKRLGPRRVIPRETWHFTANRQAIRLEGGFEKGKIYEAVYGARDPAVVGLGLAAVRDLVSYLKTSKASPAPGKRALALGISQTGRFLRHFLYQGFNADLEGRAVFDGVLAHTAGAGRGSFNHRFGQPSRDAHPFSAFFYPTDLFPFSDRVQKDPETDLEDGLLRRLAGTAALPKVFFTNTGYEYWGRAAALIHTSVDGRRDVEPLPTTRLYHLAGAQHFVDRFPPAARDTRYAANPLQFLWSLRALLVALDAWVAEGTEPPPSRYPRLADGTLTPPAGLAFPAIPGVEAPATAHEAYRADYGPRFRSRGIVDRQPPVLGSPFPVLVPRVDVDGNERGGLRLPELAVPVATYTPWNYRAEEIGAPDELADFRGAFLPFAATAAARLAAGDPRPSLEERYGTREAYLGRYAEVAVELVRGGYLLAEDLPEMLDHAAELWDQVAATKGAEEEEEEEEEEVEPGRSAAP